MPCKQPARIVMFKCWGSKEGGDVYRGTEIQGRSAATSHQVGPADLARIALL